LAASYAVWWDPGVVGVASLVASIILFRIWKRTYREQWSVDEQPTRILSSTEQDGSKGHSEWPAERDRLEEAEPVLVEQSQDNARDSPIDSDERTNQLIRELRGLGVTFPDDLDERTCQLVRELAAEKAAQLESAKAVISPLAFIVVVAAFALCFWRYDTDPRSV
jgi:hypothetical protein